MNAPHVTPRARTPGLTWEFDLWLSWDDQAPISRRVTAETPALARRAFAAEPRARVLSVLPVRPLLEDRPWLGLAAAAHYLGVSISRFQALLAEGKLARPANGVLMFHRDALDAFLSANNTTTTQAP
jgi:hypothetical protein